jgi:ATP-dependent protease ClpP protease subunit
MSRNVPWRTTRRAMALHQPSVNDWYRIRNQAGGPTQLHIYDEIGYFGVSANDLVRDLADVSGPLEVHLNSPGGDVWDGIAIYNALLARKDVAIYIDGIAASIASVIAMAGNPVLMARNAELMIHEGFTMAIGNAQDMRDAAEQLERASNNIASIYSDHTGKTIDYYRQLMKAETWFTADQAITEGLADRMIDSGAGRSPGKQEVSNQWDMTVFGSGNRQTLALNRNTRLMAAWDPDGDGDDDSTSEGDTDHSHWAADGTQKKSVPGKPLTKDGMLIDIRNASYDSSPWTAARAMQNAAAADNPASAYGAVCAGQRDGDPKEPRAHALVHHYHADVAANREGVEAALKQIDSTPGITNKDAARAHLEAHAKAWATGPTGQAGDGPEDAWLSLTDEEATNWAAALRGAKQ